MLWSGTAWAGPGLRWFVRSGAVLVGLASMVGVVAWWVGGLYVLGGEGESSLGEAIPSVIAAVAAGLLTSEIVLRAFDLPGRGFWHRYGVVVASVCVGGAIEGAMLGWVFALDGTLFPEAPLGAFAADPLGLAGLLLGAGVVGAVLGLAVGLAGGLVLGFPLAAVLGSLKGGSPAGAAEPPLREATAPSTGRSPAAPSRGAVGAGPVCGSSAVVGRRTPRLFRGSREGVPFLRGGRFRSRGLGGL